MSRPRKPRPGRRARKGPENPCALAFGTPRFEPLESRQLYSSVTVDTVNDVVDGDTTNIAALQVSPGSDGFISLREAIIAANNDAAAELTINLGDGNHHLTRGGASENSASTGDLDILSQITIRGNGATSTTISADGLNDRIFEVHSSGTLNLDGLTLADANLMNGDGGAISNQGALSVTDAVIRDNFAQNRAGALLNTGSGTAVLDRVAFIDNRTANQSGTIEVAGGTVDLVNSIVAGSSSNNSGAVAITGGSATINIAHVTFTENTTSNGGAGLFQSSGTANVSFSIFAGNTSMNGGDDLRGTIVSGGFNIIEDNSGFNGSIGSDILGSDPGLAARSLEGETYVYAIDDTSIAHNAASGSPQTVDQLGRLRDANPDIGAYEFNSVAAPPANAAPSVSLTNTTTTLTEDVATSQRVKVADIVVTDDAFGSESLSLAGADAALFEIDGTELYLTDGAALDFETNPTLNVSVQVDDATVGTNPDDTADLAISITDVNEAPSVALINTTSTLAEDAATSPRVKVADIVVSDDALGSESLSLVGADAALFEIDGAELYLIDSAALDFETNPTLSVTVQVDDTTVGGTPDDDADLVISVTDLNEAPSVALTNTTTTLAEDVATSPRIKVADIVVTDDALGSESLSLAGADASLFEIVGNELYLIDGAALDFESNPTLNVTVQVDDATVGSTPDDTADLAITVTDVNEAPAIALTNTTTSLPEDASTSPRIKVADIVVTDDALGLESLSLAGADAALFEIEGTELYLIDGAALDFETNPSLNVTVQIDDTTVGDTPADTADLAISVTDVNEAPSVVLTNTTNTLAENAATSPRVKIADIVVTDDALGSESLSLAGADAALFEIEGTELYLIDGAPLNFETNPTLNVTVQVNDTGLGGTPNDTVDLAISITDVNEAPSVALANTTTNLAEDTASSPRVKVADIVVTDDALGSHSLSLAGADASLFEIDGTELYLVDGATLDFETNPTLNVIIQIDDATFGSTPDDTADLTITITDVNEAPSVTLANTTTILAEDDATSPRIKVADIVVSDDALGSESLSLTGADASLFEIDGTELYLVDGATLDFETNPTLNVTVQVDDATVGGTPDDTADLTITVTDANEAPGLSLINVSSTLAEDPSTPRTKIADIVIDDDALGSESLTISGADAALFEIDENELFIRLGTDLDFETRPFLNITVAVDDPTVGTTPDDTADLTITVMNASEAPLFVTNQLTIGGGETVTLTRAELFADDPDDTPEQRIFTVDSVSGGRFELASSPGVEVTTFSQEQVDGGEVRFVQLTPTVAPAYALTVTDGELSDGPLEAVIDFTPVVLSADLATPTTPIEPSPPTGPAEPEPTTSTPTFEPPMLPAAGNPDVGPPRPNNLSLASAPPLAPSPTPTLDQAAAPDPPASTEDADDAEEAAPSPTPTTEATSDAAPEAAPQEDSAGIDRPETSSETDSTASTHPPAQPSSEAQASNQAQASNETQASDQVQASDDAQISDQAQASDDAQTAPAGGPTPASTSDGAQAAQTADQQIPGSVRPVANGAAAEPFTAVRPPFDALQEQEAERIQRTIGRALKLSGLLAAGYLAWVLRGSAVAKAATKILRHDR